MSLSCSFCGSSSQYTCPRCHAFYCSLQCYQSPSHQQCSEDFYKECVTKELTGENLNQESRDKMVEVLKRMNQDDNDDEEEEEDSDDDDEPIELSERLEGLNLDNADDIWEKLTKEERREFEELLKSGDVTNIIPEYVPWWKFRKEEKKIEEIGAGENSDDAFKEKCPSLTKNIQSLSEITKISPSPHVKCGLLNVLYAYAYAVRFFAGDYEDIPCEFVEAVGLLAGNLSRGENFQLSDTALEAAASEVANHSFLAVSLEFARNVKKDVVEITRGPSKSEPSFYILAALSDLKEQFKSAKQFLKNGDKKKIVLSVDSEAPIWRRNPERKPNVSLEEVKKQMRKVEYYLSWTKDYADQYFL